MSVVHVNSISGITSITSPSSSDVLTLHTSNNAERVRINSSGKVLIGTITPQGNANADDLVVSTSGHSGVTIRSGTSSHGNIFFADGTSGSDEYRGWVTYQHNNTNSLTFGTNANERLRINSGGRVNIADTNQTGSHLDYTRLNVYGQTDQGGTNKNLNLLNVYNYGSGGVGDITGIGLGCGASPGGYTKASLAFIRTSGYGRGDLIFCINSDANGNQVVEGDEKLRITSAGNVGINSTTPSQKLDVMDGTVVVHPSSRSGVALNGIAGQDVGVVRWGGDNHHAIILRGSSSADGSTITGGDTMEFREYGAYSFKTGNNSGTMAERLRIASDGDVTIDASSNSMQPGAAVNIISDKDMNGDKDDASKFHLVLKNPNNDTGEAVGLGFAITDTASKLGAVIAHKRSGAGSTGELSFYVRSGNASAPTRRLRIGPEGGVTIGSIDNGFANSLLVQAGVYISAYNGDNLITNASQGGGASTLYIGNQAIQMSSDKRIKKNIVDTTTNVLDKIKQVRVVDFDWDDPSDTASVNRNSRGKWTGCLAQEMVDIFPHVINAPRKEDNSLDYDSDRTWLVDYGHLVPTLIKGMQEQQKQIEELKAEVATLKSS